MGRQTPASSVIIATRGRGPMALDAARSILDGEVVPDELIIVDQSDRRDDSLATLQSDACDVRYHWSRTRGLSRANNEGVRLARHDVLVFTHDDVRVAPDWLSSLLQALVAAGDRAVVTGRVLPGVAEIPRGITLTMKTDANPTVYEGRIGEDVLFPLNMALWRDTFRVVGVFDPRLGPGTSFPAAEDNDLGFRLLEAGYRIVYVPDAVVEHRLWRRDYVTIRWMYGLGQGAYYAKHVSLSDRYMLGRLVRHAGRYAWRAARRAARLDRLAIGDAAAFAGMVSGAAGWALIGHRRSPDD